MARTLLFPMILALATPAVAQVHVVVDGQTQDVPAGVIRTISYEPGGRQTIHDEPLAGTTAPDCATVTTTEDTDEDDQGNVIHISVVTRIEPMVAVAYAPPMQAFQPQVQPMQQAAVDIPVPPMMEQAQAPQLAVDADALDAPDPGSSDPQVVHIHRDPMTGHFVAAIRINGVQVRAIVDTGAQSTILSAQDARVSGADKDITRSEPMAGIGGYTMLKVTRVHSMEVGGQQLGGFTAAIGAEGIPYTLLGQTEINRLGRIVIEDGVMTITPRQTEMASR